MDLLGIGNVPGELKGSRSRSSLKICAFQTHCYVFRFVQFTTMAVMVPVEFCEVECQFCIEIYLGNTPLLAHSSGFTNLFSRG
jgi:hypothetical protein